MNIKLTVFIFSLLLSLSSFAQDKLGDDSLTTVDIDQWQALKEQTLKNPFGNGNQFCINFAKMSKDEWHYPLPGAHVISPYGGKRRHSGTDIKTKPNDSIYAAFSGTVVLSQVYYGYGNTIIIRHPNGLETLYSHQSKNFVKKGDWVRTGQFIGLTGRTGRATTEHLHFETRVNGKTFDSSKLYDHNNNIVRKSKFTFTKQPNGSVRITETPE